MHSNSIIRKLMSDLNSKSTMDYRKKVTCRFWKKGFCKNGDDCAFLHGFTSKARKRKHQAAAKFKDFEEAAQENEETQSDEFWEPEDDSYNRSGESWDGHNQRFGEAQEYSDQWEGVGEVALALLSGSSTWNKEPECSRGEMRRPKIKSWSGPKRQKIYSEELESDEYRIAKDVERFLRRERNRIENVVGIAEDKYDDREFESNRGSPIFGSAYGNFGSSRGGDFSPGNSRKEESERFDRSPDRFCGSPNSSRQRSLERHNYGSPDGYDYRSPDRYRHKSTDRDRYRSPSRTSSLGGYGYRSPDSSRRRSTDRSRFRSPGRIRHLTPDKPRTRSPYRVSDWRHERLKHDLEDDRIRDLESNRQSSSEWSKPGSHQKSRHWSPEWSQRLSPERPENRDHDGLGHWNPDRLHHRSPDRFHHRSPDRHDHRSPDRLRQRSSERLGYKSQERLGQRSPERSRLRSLERYRRRSLERRRYRSPDRPRHTSPDWLRHKSPERSTNKGPRISRQRNPKRRRMNNPERNQYEDTSKELKQDCRNYKLILDRYESPGSRESTYSDYPGSCSRTSSRDENHASESASKELPNVSHGTEVTSSQGEDHIKEKVAVSEVDLQLFEKRILSNCQELLASLKDPSKLDELLKLQDQQISAELCKGSLDRNLTDSSRFTSEVVPQAKDTSAELSSPQPPPPLPLTKGEGNSNKGSRHSKQDLYDPFSSSCAPSFDNIKIVVDCKKTENKIVANTDTSRHVVLMEDAESAKSDAAGKDGKQSQLSLKVDSEKSVKSGNELLKDIAESGGKEGHTTVSEKVPHQASGRQGGRKPGSSFREEEDNYESVVEEVSQELDDVLEALKEIEDSDDCEEALKCEVDMEESTEKTLQECAADIVSSLKEGCDIIQSKLDSIKAADHNTADVLVKSLDEYQIGKSSSESEASFKSRSKSLVKVSPVKLNCDFDERKPFAKVQPYSVTYLKK